MNGGLQQARGDFPILQRTVNGKPFVYLDTAASAQKPRVVIDAMTRVYETNYSNIHRGLYNFSQVMTEEYERVRAKVAAFINAPSEREVIFTRNSTESFNLLARSWGGTALSAGDNIVLTRLEHHANIVPWQLLQQEKQFNISVLELDVDSRLDLMALSGLIDPVRTRCVSLTAVSNAIGNINNIKKINGIIKSINPKIKVFVDASQAVNHGVVNVREWGVDAAVFTGHKLYGPTGIGVLWARYELLETMPPYQGGGDMIDTVSFAGTTFKEPPYRFEAGTPPIAEVIGLGAAIDYLTSMGMNAVAAHERELTEYAIAALKTVPGLTLYGPPGTADRAGILAFNLAGIHHSDLAVLLDQQGVAVRTGHHCCMPLMEHLGVDGTVRASFGLYSTRDDVDVLVDGLRTAQRILG